MEKPLKVVFVGDSQSGKTRACQNLLCFGSHAPYKPTHGADIYKYITKKGLELTIWDCAGNHGSLGDAYYINADICVVFGHNQTPWVQNVKLLSDKVIIHPFRGLKELIAFFDSIQNGKPEGHVTDDEITVLDVTV